MVKGGAKTGVKSAAAKPASKASSGKASVFAAVESKGKGSVAAADAISSDEDEGDYEDDDRGDDDDDDDDDSDDSDDDDDDDMSSDDDSQPGLDVTFEFNDMKEEYAEGITTMMRNMIAQSHLAYEVASKVASQAVGTAVVAEQADDVYAFSSMVPVCECPEPITDMLTRVVHSASRVKGTAHSALLASLTGDGKAHTAVLMHARFSNLPLQLVGPLHRNLLEDLKWAMKQNSKSADTDGFVGLTHVLTLSPLSVPEPTKGDKDKKKKEDSSSSGSSSSSSSNSSSSSSSSKGQADADADAPALDVSGGGASNLLFDCFEDEFYAQFADAAVVFKHPVAAGKMVASLVPIAKLEAVVALIESMVPADAPQ